MPEATVSLENIQVFSCAARLRLGPRIAELRRIGRVQDVVRAANDLAEALTSYSAATSAIRTGEVGTAEVDADATRLFAAFAIFAEALGGAAADYRTRVTDDTAGLANQSQPQGIQRHESLGA